MDIHDILLLPQSKENALKLYQEAIESNDQFLILMDYFFGDDMRGCQKASWTVGKIGELHPELILPFIPKMIANLQYPLHDAFVRNTVRAWQYMEIPEEYEGQIYDICFDYISNPEYPNSIRAFSMQVCFNIAKAYPELLEELALQLKGCAKEPRKGVQSRANKILHKTSEILGNL